MGIKEVSTHVNLIHTQSCGKPLISVCFGIKLSILEDRGDKSSKIYEGESRSSIAN